MSNEVFIERQDQEVHVETIYQIKSYLVPLSKISTEIKYFKVCIDFQFHRLELQEFDNQILVYLPFQEYTLPARCEDIKYRPFLSVWKETEDWLKVLPRIVEYKLKTLYYWKSIHKRKIFLDIESYEILDKLMKSEKKWSLSLIPETYDSQFDTMRFIIEESESEE